MPEAAARLSGGLRPLKNPCHTAPLASSPFGLFARSGKTLRHKALGLRPKPRKGFTLDPVSLRRMFSTAWPLKNPCHTAPLASSPFGLFACFG